MTLRKNIQEKILQFILGQKNLHSFNVFVEKNLQEDIEDYSVYILLQYIWLKIQFLNIAQKYAETKIPYAIHPSLWNSFVKIIVFLETDLALVPFSPENSRRKKSLKIDLMDVNPFVKFSNEMPFFPFISEEIWNKHNGKLEKNNLLIYKINQHPLITKINQAKHNQEKPQKLGTSFLIQDILLRAENSLYGFMRPVLIKYSYTPDRYILHHSGIDKITDKKWQYYKKKHCKGILYNATLFIFSINVRENCVRYHCQQGEYMARGYGYQLVIKDWKMDIIPNFYEVT